MAEAITWTAAEYEYNSKSSQWYITLFVLSGAVAVAAFIFNNMLFGILILVSAFAVALLSAKPPLTKECSITKRGLTIGRTFMPWSSLDSFWVEDTRNPPHLLVKPMKFFAPLIVLPINDLSPDLVRERLSERIEEEELVEPLSHRLIDWLEW